MNDKINDEISKLESVLQSNIGEQEAYAVRYAILILKDVQKDEV